MHIQLTPARNLLVRKLRVGRVPVLHIRLKNSTHEKPGVLWIHGGGYMTGLKEMVYMSRAMDLLRNFGTPIFSPGYRLAWTSPYPAALDDCFAVLRYMHENREELGITSILVGGESAGGGLAAALCQMARDRGIPVAFQMPLYPMLSNLDTESSRDNHGRIWNTRRNHIAWKLYLRKEAKEHVSPYAAPALQTDFRGLPPCYTFVGEGEPFYAETLSYVEHLRAAGVDAVCDVYPTNVHAFDMLYPDHPVSREAILSFTLHAGKAIQAEMLKIRT